MTQETCGSVSDPGAAVGDLPFLLKQQKTIWNARKNGTGEKKSIKNPDAFVSDINWIYKWLQERNDTHAQIY